MEGLRERRPRFQRDSGFRGAYHFAHAGQRPAPVAVPGEILEELGRGGMGRRPTGPGRGMLDRQVALKMILAGELAGEQVRARFATEAEAVAACKHPNVVQVFEVGEGVRPALPLVWRGSSREAPLASETPRAPFAAGGMQLGLVADAGRGGAGGP